MKISMIVAMSENGVIGRDGDLPWRLSTDLKRFKALTLGKPVIMGRKTWESLGRPLPRRRNIVISRRPDFAPEGADLARSLEEALEMARNSGEGIAEACIIGGGEIYRQALSRAEVLHVTHVHTHVEGDTKFPEIAPEDWTAVAQEEVPAGEKDDHPSSYVVYHRN